MFVYEWKNEVMLKTSSEQALKGKLGFIVK